MPVCQYGNNNMPIHRYAKTGEDNKKSSGRCSMLESRKKPLTQEVQDKKDSEAAVCNVQRARPKLKDRKSKVQTTLENRYASTRRRYATYLRTYYPATLLRATCAASFPQYLTSQKPAIALRSPPAGAMAMARPAYHTRHAHGTARV
ncbi:hypothetical protein PLEOSDRAFT_162785 [Pleurotus ostreatus PC15]|uniref:Uncharacterized protein n=1 Tax=Pleurotus ostreatus (strain PC15) TaxID=1137138 RepID=A0A067N583_PLEO1|nr:hypothetical protein PLEOSDRAFT_162785 [Pleurotus ostreatus PC15]